MVAEGVGGEGEGGTEENGEDEMAKHTDNPPRSSGCDPESRGTGFPKDRVGDSRGPEFPGSVSARKRFAEQIRRSPSPCMMRSPPPHLLRPARADRTISSAGLPAPG